MTDNETAAAIDALVYRVKARDAAIRDGGDYPDAEPFALEFLTVLRGRGWRPTPARAVAPPMHAPAGTASTPRDETIAGLRADMEARAAAARAREDGAA